MRICRSSMGTTHEQDDPPEDSQLMQLLKAYGDAPAMRPEFVSQLSERLDKAFLQSGLLKGGLVDLPANGSAALSTLSNHVEAPSTHTGRARVRRRWRAAILFVTAASLLAAIAFWNSRPAYGWATMIEALDRGGWVRAEAAEGDGKVSGWASAARGVVAVQSEGVVEFIDRRQRAHSAFRRDQNKLYQAVDVEKSAWRWEEELVRLILSIDSDADPSAQAGLSNSLRVKVESESWTRAVRDGRELI